MHFFLKYGDYVNSKVKYFKLLSNLLDAENKCKGSDSLRNIKYITVKHC